MSKFIAGGRGPVCEDHLAEVGRVITWCSSGKADTIEMWRAVRDCRVGPLQSKVPSFQKLILLASDILLLSLSHLILDIALWLRLIFCGWTHWGIWDGCKSYSTARGWHHANLEVDAKSGQHSWVSAGWDPGTGWSKNSLGYSVSVRYVCLTQTDCNWDMIRVLLGNVNLLHNRQRTCTGLPQSKHTQKICASSLSLSLPLSYPPTLLLFVWWWESCFMSSPESFWLENGVTRQMFHVSLTCGWLFSPALVIQQTILGVRSFSSGVQRRYFWSAI